MKTQHISTLSAPAETEAELDRLVPEIRDRFAAKGTIVPDEFIRPCVLIVLNGVALLDIRFTDWSRSLSDKTIDIANPASSPYNMVIACFKVDIGCGYKLSPGTMRDCGFVMPSVSSILNSAGRSAKLVPNQVRLIMNEIWTHVISERGRTWLRVP